MKKKHIWHIALVLYIIFIFSNSLTPADISSENSGFVLRLVHNTLSAVGIQALWLTEHVIRKCAHFSEYTVLGILLYQSVKHLPLEAGMKRTVHLGAVFFIPFVDETLQLFTAGRSGQISDVWLDMSGVMFGTILSILFFKGKKTVTKNKNRIGNKKIG